MPHPATPAATIEIKAELTRLRLGGIRLWFVLTGDLDLIQLPEPSLPARVDGLWRHTCFELFVRHSNSPTYCEFNLSPSGEWAAYSFQGYRNGMLDLEVAAPLISTAAISGHWSIGADLILPFDQGTRCWVNPTAVIEEKSGRRSYWALAHPPSGPPDFHHPDCFVLELPPAPGA